MGSKSGFLLLGESGIGKTNLLCHKVDEWRERGEIILFYAGHQLNPDEPMEQRLLSDLYLQGDFILLLEFVRREGRRFIVVVDGVNEHPQSAKLLKCLCEFVQRYGRNFPLKVILSVRSVFFTRMLQALGEGRSEEQLKSLEAGLFPSTIFQTHTVEREGRGEETHRFELEAVDEDELREIYESYRAFEGYWTEEGQLRRFRPTTPYESLTPQVRQVLRHPWLLRMVMEAYDGKPVPERLWTGDILNAFCEAKIFGRTDEEREQFAPRSQLVTELVRLMRRHKRDNFLRDELHDFSAEWSKALLERELTRSPYLQLLDEGVLMETPIIEEWGRFRRIVGYQVRFAFDLLFEFFLYNELLAEGGGWKGLTGENVAKWLSEGSEFDHLTGAVMILLTEAVQEGNFKLIADTLNSSDFELAEPVIVEVLTTLEGLRDERFELLLDELAKKADGEKALRSFIIVSLRLCKKHCYNSAFICASKAEQLGRHLVEIKGQKELLSLALSCKGIALSGLGRLREAISCYNEAIKIIKRSLVKKEGKVGIESALASIMVNKGMTLRDLGRFKDAINCYDEAIEIYKQLVNDDKRVELESELAETLMNKAIALSDLGRSKDAINYFDEAIRIEMHLSEVEGKTEFEKKLAIVLMNKGNELWKLKRSGEAINFYEKAIEIVNRLIEIEEKTELESILAVMLMNKGLALQDLGHYSEAIGFYDKAIEICKRLLEVKERVDLQNFLALLLLNKGGAFYNLGHFEEAINYCDEAIKIYKRLVEVEGMSELKITLGLSLLNKSIALWSLGRVSESVDCFERALKILIKTKISLVLKIIKKGRFTNIGK